MARVNVVAASATIFCVATSACESNGDLFASTIIALPARADAGTPERAGVDAPPTFVVPADALTEYTPPVAALPPAPAVEPSGSDAGVMDPESDAGPAPALPRPVSVSGPVLALPLLGVVGGDPRLGVCEGGVVIGVRTTANPSLEVFGQRITFVEPICGSLLQDASGAIRVTRDDSMLDWAVTGGFFGVPNTTVPDPRLVWLLQPATLCPEAAPVVVGLSGEYDPVAPDVVDTAAIRSLFIECAPLLLAPNGSDVVAAASGHQSLSNADSFAVGGGATYRSACDGGRVTTQIQVHAGFWLDGFVLGCSNLRVE